MLIPAVDLCVVRDAGNRYSSMSFEKFCSQYIEDKSELKLIFAKLSLLGLFCPTIFVNKKYGKIILKYEYTDNNVLHIAISKEIISFTTNDTITYSTKSKVSIIKAIDDLHL